MCDSKIIIDNHHNQNKNQNQNKKQEDNNNNTLIIDVFRINQKYYFVWDSSDADVLRNKYRLVGCLVGLVVNTHTLGGTVPLLLSVEEVALGVKLGWLQLRDEGTLVVPLLDEIEQLNQTRQQDATRQIDIIVEKKRQKDQQFKESNNNENNLNCKKKQKKLQKKQEKQERKDKKEKEMQGNVDASAVENVKETKQQQRQQQNFEGMAHIKLFTSIAEVMRYAEGVEVEGERRSEFDVADGSADHSVYGSWRKRRQSGPVIGFEMLLEEMTEIELQRFYVFEDLWRRGYYITNGSKFGGSFLAYPGDPLLHHSDLIVIIRPHTETVSSRELSTMARLAVSVNKTTLLATAIPQQAHSQQAQQHKVNISFKIDYLTLTWEGVT